MNQFKYILIVIFLIFSSCAKDEKKISNIKEISQELEMIEAYNEAYDKLSQNDPYFAAKKFLEAELLFPQSEWAPKSALMASYSYYLQNYYSEALSNLSRYLKTYPKDKNLVYAHYLIAMCHYEMIEDEKRDIKPILESKIKFNYILENYPNTDFALDARFKIDFIQDILASKEMYLGRHYQKKGKWIPAINRFKYVVTEYEDTIFIEEALHRLVEINYKIGLKQESEKYASLLGYNYLSSQWYEKTYKIFNKNYKKRIPKKIKNKKKGVIEKFKKIFD
jgi:outer membrane protein assembly factor BamD|tara:strand:- start:322 stop:1158 length:837 start_codon:yes stop_codon:yes gene_type:complete